MGENFCSPRGARRGRGTDCRGNRRYQFVPRVEGRLLAQQEKPFGVPSDLVASVAVLEPVDSTAVRLLGGNDLLRSAIRGPFSTACYASGFCHSNFWNAGSSLVFAKWLV